MSEINKNLPANSLETRAVAPTEQTFLPLNMVLNNQEDGFSDPLIDLEQWKKELPSRTSSELAKVSKQLQQVQKESWEAKYLETQKTYLENCLKLTSQKPKSETIPKNYSEIVLPSENLNSQDSFLPKTTILGEALPGFAQVEGERLNQLFFTYFQEVREKIKGASVKIDLSHESVSDKEFKQIGIEIENFFKTYPNFNKSINIGQVDFNITGTDIRVSINDGNRTGLLISGHAEAANKAVVMQGFTENQIYSVMGMCPTLSRTVTRLLRHTDLSDKVVLVVDNDVDQLGAYGVNFNSRFDNSPDDVFVSILKDASQYTVGRFIGTLYNELVELQAVAAFMKFAGMSPERARDCVGTREFQCTTSAISEMMAGGRWNFDDVADPNTSLERRQAFANEFNAIYRTYLEVYSDRPRAAESLNPSEIAVLNQYTKNMLAVLDSDTILVNDPRRPYSFDATNTNGPVSANNIVNSSINLDKSVEIGESKVEPGEQNTLHKDIPNAGSDRLIEQFDPLAGNPNNPRDLVGAGTNNFNSFLSQNNSNNSF